MPLLANLQMPHLAPKSRRNASFVFYWHGFKCPLGQHGAEPTDQAHNQCDRTENAHQRVRNKPGKDQCKPKRRGHWPTCRAGT